MGRSEQTTHLVGQADRAADTAPAGQAEDKVRHALLSAVEEQELAGTIEAGLIAGQLLNSLLSRPPDTPTQATPHLTRPCTEVASLHGSDASRAELELLVAEGESARQRFLTANLGLVGMVSRGEARRRGLSAEELFQEGVLGLVEGLHRFDHCRGVRFASYALIWIRAAVQAACNRRCDEVDMLGVRADQVRVARAVWNRLVQERGREPSLAEVAEELGRSVNWVLARLDHRRPMSLSSQAGDSIDVRDDRPELALAAVIEGPVMEEEQLLGDLTALQREVVRRRFGFTGARQTYREVGAALGLSLSSVRRVETRALDRLRSRCCTDARPLAA